MAANKVLLNDIGGTGVFDLMAEKLSSAPRSAQRVGSADDVSGAGNAKVMRLMAEAEARDSFLVQRPLYTRYAPGLTSEAGRAITRSGMWSGVGFVGASVVAAGLLLLIDGGATAGIALALVVAGGAAATFGWRSAWKVLDGIDRISVEAPDAAAPVDAVRGGDVNAVALRIAPAHPRTALGAR